MNNILLECYLRKEATKNKLVNMLVLKSQTIGWAPSKCVHLVFELLIKCMNIVFDNNGEFTL